MKWRFINTGLNNGAYNMAVDEAIMQQVSEGASLPTLRFYGWSPPSISLGYFQGSDKSINTASCRFLGIDIVRRLTGGRAVLHDKELTYSIIIPEKLQGMPSSVSESYKVLSQGLLEGFTQLGIKASLAPHTGKRSEIHSSAACFDAPSSYELEVGNKKIVGSAQVRQNGVILQHGSILNDLDIDLLFKCLSFDNEATMERAKRVFSGKATCIKDIKGEPIEWNRLCQAFYKGFEKGLNINLEPGQFSKEELSLAELLEDKYSNNEWNFKK